MEETGVDNSDRLERVEDVLDLVVRGSSSGGRLGEAAGEVWITLLVMLSTLAWVAERGLEEDGCVKPVMGSKGGTMGSRESFRRIPLEGHELRSGKETKGSGIEPKSQNTTANKSQISFHVQRSADDHFCFLPCGSSRQ